MLPVVNERILMYGFDQIRAAANREIDLHATVLIDGDSEEVH